MFIRKSKHYGILRIYKDSNKNLMKSLVESYHEIKYLKDRIKDGRNEYLLLRNQVASQAKYIEQLKKRHPDGRYKKIDVDSFNGA